VEAVGRRIEVRGVVQGVGFRPWVYRLAQEAAVGGRVFNHARGVTIEAFGPAPAVAGFVAALRRTPPPAAEIRELTELAIPARPEPRFVIETSETAGDRQVSIPPDLATCPECLREVADPADRRHGYAFTNCTHCGPRFSIALGIPYDRPATTMSAFAMCPRCRAEYDDPSDRRFHAQPNACPDCGPRLSLLSPQGTRVDGAFPLAGAAAALRGGQIVAVKGIGGFHLACDATSAAAVVRLRQRKHRDEKPFAVMARDLIEAESLAYLTAAERALLVSVERPIVLVTRRPAGAIVADVAPGSPLLGLLLPYSPLHQLLLGSAGRPLVMTSANLSDEPMAVETAEALDRLHGVADLFLVHDRAIATRCDDSIARVVARRPVLLRRSRGYVPRGVALPRPVAAPVLACGGQLKNTFAVAAGDTAVLGPHIGDLDDARTLADYEWAVERLLSFLKLRPEVVAHDLHPDYLSTAYALRRPETRKVAVQHHHAHVAAVMAEHGLAGPVLGVAYDGTGHGSDGRTWGGEILLASYSGFERLATLRPIPLAGGDAATHGVWRIALALLDDAFGRDAPLDGLPLFAGVRASEIAVVRRMLATGFNTPGAHSVGRLFDGIGALALARPWSSHEGQVALLLNVAAAASGEAYAFDLDLSASPWQLDWRPIVRAAVHDLRGGRSAAHVSARFHAALVRATGELLRAASRRCGRLPVVLSGGCFQNPLLAEGLLAELGPGVDVRLASQVPPGDGGLSLGQALVADAIAWGGR